MAKLSKEKSSSDEKDIVNCDTASTQSQSSSAVSISPVSGDDSGEVIKNWLMTSNQQHEHRHKRKSHLLRIHGGKEEEEESVYGHDHDDGINLNDAMVLSHIEGMISIPFQDQCENEILIAPSTIEERQNEKFARKVGIHFSLAKGDHLTLMYGQTEDDYSASVESELSASPQYGKRDKEHTFRKLYGDVSQIFDADNRNQAREPTMIVLDVNNQNQEYEPMTPGSFQHQELITPRTRTAMINHDQIAETLRPIAATLSVDWGKKEYMAPTLARRLRDFEFAQKKRMKAFGISRKWGLLALYEFLAAVREDVEWAESAAWRRANCLPYVRWIDYVQSKRRGSNQPIFVYSILFICTIALITSIGINNWMFESMKANPSFGPSAETLIIMGAKQSSLIVNDYQIWRLLTPMFLHGGLIHYLLNCFALFYIGKAVEQSHGTISATILFVIPAIGSVIFSSIFLPQYISVGSSGGIFGLIGACTVDVVRNRRLLFSDFIDKGRSKKHHTMVIVILFLDIILNLLVGLTPFTDNWMHVGGFLLGIFCASTLLNTINLFGMQSFQANRVIYSFRNSFAFRYFGVIASIMCIIAATIVLFIGDGVSSPCESCAILSCVSFPPWANYDSRWWYCDECGDVKGLGKIHEVTGEYFAIQLECPSGEMIEFELADDIDKSHTALEENLPMLCREECLN